MLGSLSFPMSEIFSSGSSSPMLLAVEAKTHSQTPGATAALSDEGLQNVLAMHNSAETAKYVHRIIGHLGLEVSSESGMSTFIPQLAQSMRYSSVEEKIREHAGEAGSWVKAAGVAPALPPKPASVASIGATAALDEGGYLQVAGMNHLPAMRNFFRRVVSDCGLRVSNEDKLEEVARRFMGSATQSYKALRQEVIQAGEDSSWLTASSALPKAQVAAKVDELYSTASADALDKGIASFSATSSSDSSGAAAQLSEAGFRQVQSAGNEEEMKTFVRRVVSHVGLKVRDEIGLTKAVKEFKLAEGQYASAASKSFDALQEYVMSFEGKPSSWVCAPATCDMQVHTGATAPFNEEGYRAVVALRSNTEMSHYVRRLIAELGYDVNGEGDFAGFVPFFSGVNPGSTQNFTTLRKEIVSAAGPHSWVSTMSSGPIASKAAGGQLGSSLQLAEKAKGPGSASKDVERHSAPLMDD